MPAKKIEPGTMLGGRYRIDRCVGEGGMAVVYQARDLRHDRDVAVKVLRPELASTVGVDRFLQEIRIAANLTHPHLLPVHDSGQSKGLLYYVMPYYAGESLRERLNRLGELSPESVVSILRDVLDALGHAHEQGVLHRDIKPANVLLQGRHAMLADFGIAKALCDAAVSSEMTQAGAVIGTLAYMAPEQASGEPGIDHRADIYSVGAMAYELLTGLPPFHGGTGASLLGRHIAEEPVPLQQRRPDIPEALARAVMRCLEKRPEDRDSSAHELRAEISASLPLPGTVESAPARSVRWRVLRAGAVVGALGAVLALGMDSPGAAVPEVPPPQRVVVDQFEDLTNDAAFAPIGAMLQDWLTEGLLGSGLVETVPTLTARRTSAFVAGEVEAGRVRDPLAALSREAGAELVVSGSVYLEGDTLRVQADVIRPADGRVVATVPSIEGATGDISDLLGEVRERLLGALGSSLDRRLAVQVGAERGAPRFAAYSALDEGLEYYGARDYRDASERFLRAFELDSGYVVPLLYASLSLRNHGEWARSDSVVRILEQRREELAEYQGLWVDYSRAVLEGDLDRARVVIRRVAEIAPASKASYNWALTALRMGRPEEARGAMQSLDPDRGAMRGDPRFWMRLADASHQLGDHERELEEVEELEDRHPDDRSVLVHRVRALAALGRTDDLVDLLETELAVGRLSVATLARRYRQAAVELSVHGHVRGARQLASLGVVWIDTHGSPASAASGFVAGADATALHPQLDDQKARMLEVLGYGDRALTLYQRLFEERPDSWWLPGQIGVAAASLGDGTLALEADAWLAEATPPYRLSTVTTWRAAIAARLGDEVRAVALLKQARREGQFWSSTHAWFHLHDALRHNEDFARFMAPHG